MTELSLFTGAGGGLLGTKLLNWRTLGYVEYEDYCQRVIAQRIEDGLLDDAPMFGDIRAFISEGYAESYQGMVDVVTAGFPCQPFSVAGKRAGADDPRNMWPATLEVICKVRPRFCLLENVSALLVSGYFGTVLGGLAEGGYDCRWRILSAAEMGGAHRRDRLWIVAHTRGMGWENELHFQDRPNDEASSRWNACFKDDVRAARNGHKHCRYSDDVRICDGLAEHVDRLTAIGNGQVPIVAATAWRLLTEDLKLK